MVQFKVRAESLDEVSALMQSVIATFDSNVSTARSQVTSVVDASWRGPDADTFSQAWTEFEATTVTVRAALEGLALALQNASLAYNATESGVNNAVSTSNAPVASLSVKGAPRRRVAP
jgi:WXG100 family type VII secretion target